MLRPVVTFLTVTTLLVAAWVAFAVYLMAIFYGIFNGLNYHDALSESILVPSLMFYMTSPTFLVQEAAWYGLAKRKVWGREAATVAAMVLIFTIIGIAFAYWMLKQMWPAQAPAAATASATATATA